MVDAIPWLLVGLGNPGTRYAGNRHNVGFMVVERWLDRHGTAGVNDWREKFHGRTTTVQGGFGRVVVLEPLTYMNRSGRSVGAAASFFHVPPARIVVVHDEVDFDRGRLAVKQGGGHGGHNGLRDLIAALGSPDFVRVRVGVGRPTHGEVADWVLSNFTADELAIDVPDLIARAEAAVTCVLAQGLDAAMNAYNQKTAPKG